MTRRVILTCISPAIRNILQAETHHVADPATRQAFEALLNEAPDCKDGGVIGLELEEEQGKQKRAKRPPSEYNLFVGKCLRDRPKGQPVSEAMKGCALRWRQRKPKSEGGK